MKITILDNIYLNYDDERLANLGDVKYYTRLEKEFIGNDQELVERIADSEVIVSCHVTINRTVIEKCKNLKYITTSSTGVDNIDLDAAKEYGVIVSNIPNYGTMSVAQSSVALLLEITNKISEYNNLVHQNKWKECPDWCLVNEDLIELDGKTAGIIGYGQIGRATGNILKSFGMNIITYDISDGEEKLDYLLANSDVISLHCPLTASNKYIINKDSIAKMKDKVILINTSRGALVNSDDLYEALLSKKIYFAGFDVIDGEPVGKEHKLLTLPNFILTPHIAWATKESRLRVVDLVCKNIESYIENKPINTVNT